MLQYAGAQAQNRVMRTRDDVAGAFVRTGDLLFYIPFVVYLTTEILRTSFYARYLPGSGLFYAGFAVLLLVREILFVQYEKRDWILLALTGLICLNVFRVNSMAAAVMFFFIFAARHLSFRDLARVTLLITAVTLAFVILSAYAGWIYDYKFIGEKRTRRYLGFGYALYPGCYLAQIAMLYVWLKKHRVSYLVLAAIWAANYWIYRETDARLSFYMLTALLAVAVLLRITPGLLARLRPLHACAVASFVIGPVISCIAAARYSTAVPWMVSLNATLGRRLLLGQRALHRYGISLLGGRVTWIGNGLDEFGRAASGEYLYVDNLFLQYLIHYGVITCGILIALIIYALYRLYKTRQYYLLVLFLLLAGHAMLDDLIYRLHYNLFWLIIPMVIMERKRGRSDESSL